MLDPEVSRLYSNNMEMIPLRFLILCQGAAEILTSSR
jgi:hypothetical protein